MPAIAPIRVLVTGAGGNLGCKLVADLVERGWCTGVVAVDRAFAADPAPHAKVRRVEMDLRVRSAALDDATAMADAAVHLAAQNPDPDASWADASASFDMTLNLTEALTRHGGARRCVFASSNHVMGGYNEEGLAPYSLTTALPPRPGTPTGGATVVPQAYAAAKLMGERFFAARASARRDFTAVSLRIGWCQPGVNHPRTISASGVPRAAAPVAAEDDRDLLWFRSMWLSDRDFVDVVAAALTADAAAWPQRAVTLNAMSDNRGMPWDIAATRALLGYAPRDDVWRTLDAPEQRP